MHLYREYPPHPLLAGHVACLWTSHAAPCGYYDQSHLIHEFQRFAGETPQDFAGPQAEQAG